MIVQLRSDPCVQVREALLGHALEGPGGPCQPDPRRAGVGGIGFAPNEAIALHLADQRRHRLLGQPGTTGQGQQPLAVLLEERQQNRSVRRSDLGKPALGERLREKLIPALGCLGEQETQVAGSGPRLDPWNSMPQ